MDQLFSIIVMLAGVGLVLYGKGILAARSADNAFNFVVFLSENTHRLMLAAFGIVVSATIIFLDPLGWQELVKAVGEYYSETLARTLQIGSPAIIGIAIGGLALMLPKTATTEDK